MLSVDQVWQAIDSLEIPALSAELVDLEHALDRRLGEELRAPEDMPSHNRSSIDGYLVAPGQEPGVVRLVSSCSATYEVAAILPAVGTCMRVLTGAPVPDQAELVMQEDTTVVSSDSLRLNSRGRSSLVRPKGSHARLGDCLMKEGTLLNAGAIALLAAAGVAHPRVKRRPRVSHLVTGGELVEPHLTPPRGSIRDSNSSLVHALLRQSGALRVWHRLTGDSRDETLKAMYDGLLPEPDLLLVSGGASVGDYDHSAGLLEELGFTIHCRKVASRPGKPFVLASKGVTVACVLPGNPLSHFVCYHLFVARIVNRLFRVAPRSLQKVPLSSAAKTRVKANPRESWWPATFDGTEWQPAAWADSGDLTTLASTQGLLRVPRAGIGPGAYILPTHSP